MRPGRFTGICRNDWVDRDWYRAVRTDPLFSYTSAKYSHITITPEDGFEHDGGSIPKLLRWFIGKREFLPIFEIHDKGYQQGGHPRCIYDYILREGVYTITGGHAPFKRLVIRLIMYPCGYSAWQQHRRSPN